MFLKLGRIILVAAGIILAQGGMAYAQFSISGTVTDPGLTPVPNVDIFLYTAQGDPIGIPPTITDASGFYTITGLPSGTYGVGFEPSTASGLLVHYEPNVVVTSNVTLDVTLQQGYFLTGFVTDTFGVGIPDIDLNVYDQASGNKLVTPGDNTDATGFYEVVIPLGTFRLRWRAVNGEKLVPVELENITVNGDTSVSISMLPGFFVSGTVVDNLGQPVFDADLDFEDAITGQLIATPGDNTDVFGYYSAIIPAGFMNINVEPKVADKLVADEKYAVPISNDTVINFTLQAGVYVSGTVSAANGGAAVGGADIDVWDAVTHVKLTTPGDNTDALGQYLMVVPAGLLNIGYQPPVATLLAPIVLNNVNVVNDTIIDVTVPDGLLFSGTITGPSGLPAVGVDIDAEKSATGESVSLVGDATDASGVFAVVVEPGTYNIDYEPPLNLHLAPQKLLNLTLTTSTDIPISLDTGMLVSGIVRDSLGLPDPLVKVRALLSSTGDTVFTPANLTDGFGNYNIMLAPNTYDLVYTTDSLLPQVDTMFFASVPIYRDTILNVDFPAGQVGGGDSCCISPIRGNVDYDLGDNIDISDLVYLVDYMFVGGTPPPCFIEANINGYGGIDISDLVYLVDYMFTGGPAPVPCPLL